MTSTEWGPDEFVFCDVAKVKRCVVQHYSQLSAQILCVPIY